MGIFQYFLLYAWPHPGNIADRKVAIFGLCFFVTAVSSASKFLPLVSALVFALYD